jgi:hypothetical protein
MRVAAALHIFAAELRAEIFRPWYVPGSAKDSLATKQTVNRHFGAVSRKGDIVRALLLSSRQTEDEENAVINTARTASEHVHEQLEFFLNDDGTIFRAGLEELFHEAANLWLEMQHSQKIIETQIEEPHDSDYEYDWSHLKTFGEIIPEQQILRSEPLCLFPRFYTLEDEKVVHHGYVLWNDQSAVLSARQELNECKARNRRATSGGSTSGSTRRDSLVTDIRSGNIPSPQTSPTNRKKDFLIGGAVPPSNRSSGQT